MTEIASRWPSPSETVDRGRTYAHLPKGGTKDTLVDRDGRGWSSYDAIGAYGWPLLYRGREGRNDPRKGPFSKGESPVLHTTVQICHEL